VTLTVDARRPDPEAIARAAEALREGRIVAYATDTLYGLAVDPRNPAAVAALFEAKGRAGHLATPLIAADREQVAQVAHMNDRAERLAAAFWPGPLTLVLPATAAVAPGVAAADGSIAIRVPDHPVARALAAAFGHPVTATSANRTGDPAAVDGAAAAIGDAVAVVLDSGPARGGPPSTIVDVRGETPRLVRDGVLAWNRVLESLE
jgi:L-threonylcarbamoyladenylate synthase